MNNNFDYHKLPSAYLSENKESRKLRDMLKTNESACSNGILHDVFFSSDNIELINKQLIYEVFQRSEKKLHIGQQDSKKMKIVMRYVWNIYAKHLPFKIKEQILKLNCKVVNEIRDGVMSNAMQKIDYLVEINRPRILLSLPVNVNKLGKTLPSISDIYHK